MLVMVSGMTLVKMVCMFPSVKMGGRLPVNTDDPQNIAMKAIIPSVMLGCRSGFAKAQEHRLLACRSPCGESVSTRNRMWVKGLMGLVGAWISFVCGCSHL